MFKKICDRCAIEVNKCDKCQNWFEMHDIFSFNITSYQVDAFGFCVNSEDGKSYKPHVESFKFCKECWKNTEKKPGSTKLEAPNEL